MESWYYESAPLVKLFVRGPLRARVPRYHSSPRTLSTLTPQTTTLPTRTPGPHAGPAASERALVSMMARGDARGAAGLFDRHGGVLFGLALCMVREPRDAEAVVIGAFAIARREASACLSSNVPPRDWLLALVRAQAIVLIRERGPLERR